MLAAAALDCAHSQNVSILTKADRCSLFLVQGERGSESRCLVSKLFDVCSLSTLKEMEKKEEIRIPWGSGIVGYVAQSGEPVNIPDAYKVTCLGDEETCLGNVSHFTDTFLFFS